MTWSRSRNVAAVALIAALAFGAASSAVLASEQDVVVSSTAVLGTTGPVLVRHAGDDFTPAHQGDVLAAGDMIRTGADASAEITYFDGSSVRLDGNAEIVVESLRVCDAGAVHTLARAWHVVTNLISGSTRYETRGPSSTASVRG